MDDFVITAVGIMLEFGFFVHPVMVFSPLFQHLSLKAKRAKVQDQ